LKGVFEFEEEVIRQGGGDKISTARLKGLVASPASLVALGPDLRPLQAEVAPERDARKMSEDMPDRTASSGSQRALPDLNQKEEEEEEMTTLMKSRPSSLVFIKVLASSSLPARFASKNMPERMSEYMSELWQTGMTVFLSPWGRSK